MNWNFEKISCSDASEERLGIEVTTQCNNFCKHCFVRARNSKQANLSVDVVKEIIAEGFSTGYRHLQITGGEPLLWNGLIEVLDYAMGMGYKTVFLNTNGTLFSEDITNRLALYENLSLSVSLQGPETLHNHFRGQGSYNRTVHGIEKALDAGLDLLIFTTACKSLLPDLPHFVDKIYRDFPSINRLTVIQLIRVMDDVFDLSDELLDPDDFIQLVRMVSFLNLCGLKIDVLNNPLVSVVSKLLEMPWMSISPPLYRAGRFVVLANRDLALAHSSRSRFGKYEPGMIEKMLNSHEYQKATEYNKTTCPKCRYFRLCIKNGMVRPSEWFRDMHSEVPYCKRVLDKASQ